MKMGEEDDNGWRLEEDTEIRRDLDALTKMLSVPPAVPPRIPKKRALALKIGLFSGLVAVSFVLGILYAQNVQLKQSSSKLTGEQAKLNGHVSSLTNTVDRCQEALTVCSEDVDLLQGLSEYNLSPAEKYGKGYASVQILQNSADVVVAEQARLQGDIEDMVAQIRRPSHVPKLFWKELRQKLSDKRKLDRKLKRIEKKRLHALAELDEAFIEKKIHFKELIRDKNEKRKAFALELETEPGESGRAPNKNEETASAPTDVPVPETGDTPKQDLASIVPSSN